MEVQTKAKQKKLPKPNNIFTIPSENTIEFFKWWCIFLKPFIKKLTNKEIEVMANFLAQRYELSKKTSDQTMLDTLVMSDNVKNAVVQACGITKQHFYVIMGNLRKNKVIENDTINPHLIPNIREDDNGCFQLLILFKNNLKA